MNFTKFARRNYLQGATPLELMPNLTNALGGDVNLYIKRDDLLPGAAGGNKTRKLEFCIADAIEKGATVVAGGKIPENIKSPEGITGNYYPPTILTDLTDDMDIVTTEVFGPVMLIFKV